MMKFCDHTFLSKGFVGRGVIGFRYGEGWCQSGRLCRCMWEVGGECRWVRAVRGVSGKW